MEQVLRAGFPPRPQHLLFEYFMETDGDGMAREPFIGIGHNPEGPDLPLGFGMQLAQEPDAVASFGRLSKGDRAKVIQYIQAATTGDDAKRRVLGAVDGLKRNDLSMFGQ